MLARAPPETQRKENWAARPPKEFDFLTFEMNQSGLTQQVLYWGVGGKTKQNTMEQQPTCTNTRWMRLLGEELLKQMANIHFSFRPMSLALKTSSPRAQTPPPSIRLSVWKWILLIQMWPLKGWDASSAPWSWSPPWSSSETPASQLDCKGTSVICTISCPRWEIFHQSLRFMHWAKSTTL